MNCLEKNIRVKESKKTTTIKTSTIMMAYFIFLIIIAYNIYPENNYL